MFCDVDLIASIKIIDFLTSQSCFEEAWLTCWSCVLVDDHPFVFHGAGIESIRFCVDVWASLRGTDLRVGLLWDVTCFCFAPCWGPLHYSCTKSDTKECQQEATCSAGKAFVHAQLWVTGQFRCTQTGDRRVWEPLLVGGGSEHESVLEWQQLTVAESFVVVTTWNGCSSGYQAGQGERNL